MSAKVSIINADNATLPRVAFDAIKDEVLGSHYELNVIFVGPKEIKKLNLMYRDKNVPTDILSFPYSDGHGEIYICLEESRKEMKKFEREFENFMSFLFIHGCVHLKGYDHSGTMEAIEEKVRAKFGI